MYIAIKRADTHTHRANWGGKYWGVNVINVLTPWPLARRRQLPSLCPPSASGSRPTS